MVETVSASDELVRDRGETVPSDEMVRRSLRNKFVSDAGAG